MKNGRTNKKKVVEPAIEISAAQKIVILEREIDQLRKRNSYLLECYSDSEMASQLRENRLRVLNRAATNYTIQFNENGKEITFGEYRKLWRKARGFKPHILDP